MVKIYVNGWVLITLMYQYGCETNSSIIDTKLYDDKCTTEARNNLTALPDDARRTHMKKHTSTEKNSLHNITNENTKSAEFRERGRFKHHEVRGHQHNNVTGIRQKQAKELTKKAEKVTEPQLKIKEDQRLDTIKIELIKPRDIESNIGGTKPYLEEVSSLREKNNGGIEDSKMDINRKETTTKNKQKNKKTSQIEQFLSELSNENELNAKDGLNNSQLDTYNKKLHRFHTESRLTLTDTGNAGTTKTMKLTEKSNHKKSRNIIMYPESINAEHRLKISKHFSENNYRNNHIEKFSDESKNNSRNPIKLRAKAKIKDLNLLRSTKMASANKFESKESLEIDRSAVKHAPKNVSSTEDLSPYAIEQQMKRLKRRYRVSMNITTEVIGRTVEYNSIVLVKITEAEKDETYFRVKESKYADEAPEKKIIFIVHGLSVMGMRYLIPDEKMFHKLLKYYTEHLEKFDIFLIPMANPDGYAATCNSQAGQYWNKNMAPQSGCPGVALDRNFDVAWNYTPKISSCSPRYPGPVPFSEAETRAIRHVLRLYSHKIVAYIHVHASSYHPKIFKGDAILYPRGYTDIQTDDDKYIDLRGEIDESMKNSSFRVLTVTTDTLYNWYGKVTGTSVDYAATIYGIPYAMEFAMQIYKGVQQHAIETVWKRLIDVVFNNIWKTSHINANELNKK